MRFRRRRRVTLKSSIDYKDVDLLRGFMDDRAKILPRRLTRLNTKQLSVQEALHYCLLQDSEEWGFLNGSYSEKDI